jgi:uncharacterized protein YecE (DUF72 family)
VAQKPAKIHVGIGGWTFAPWRSAFYPPGLPHAKELAYASRRLTSIEINGTFYRSQSAATFRKWASETPDGFVFSVKGPRFVVQRGVLAEAGDSLKRFFESGVLELADRLGPVLWQLAPTKKFDEADFGAFLELLPAALDGRKIRHVVEARHPSFKTSAFLTLLRKFGVAVAFSEHATYPAIADVTADFVYARLQKCEETIPTGYEAEALDHWAARACSWAAGSEPADLPRVEPDREAKAEPRDVYVYFIHEGKVRAPAAATALIERLGRR